MRRSRSGLVYVLDQFPALSETFVQNELRELRRRGLDPEVFALYPLRGTADGSAADIAHTVLPSPSRHLGAVASATARVALRHPVGLAKAVAVASARPSRLQAHCLSKAVLLVASLAQQPARFHAHFARASASTAMLAAVITGSRFSFTAHAIDIFWKPFDVARKLKRADVTITVCQYNVDYIEEQWPGLGRIAVAPCGVEIGSFSRRSTYSKDPFTILSVARLVEKKGLPTLIEACALLRSEERAFRCRIIGEGPEHDRLARMIETAGLQDFVSLEGAANAREVIAALEEASVFCLPCTIAPNGDRDSQPVVVKEAMAMEVPVVGTAVVAMPEMIDDEVGRLVPADDPVALAAALSELSALPADELAAMGSRGRRRVGEQFSLDQQVTLLIQAWRTAD